MSELTERRLPEWSRVVPVNCTGHLPPAFIDYVLSRKLADGVLLLGCSANACHNRFGMTWTEQRIAGTRDPHLRARVPRERLRTVWAGRLGRRQLLQEIEDYCAVLRSLPPPDLRHKPAAPKEEFLDA